MSIDEKGLMWGVWGRSPSRRRHRGIWEQSPQRWAIFTISQ